MSINDPTSVDIVSTDKAGRVVLTITDETSWRHEGHLLKLQEKVNAYLRFIESGELESNYPKAKGKPIGIRIIIKYRPNAEAKTFFVAVKERLESAGYSFDVMTLREYVETDK
jgi:hypothetical protein